MDSGIVSLRPQPGPIRSLFRSAFEHSLKACSERITQRVKFCKTDSSRLRKHCPSCLTITERIKRALRRCSMIRKRTIASVALTLILAAGLVHAKPSVPNKGTDVAQQIRHEIA